MLLNSENSFEKLPQTNVVITLELGEDPGSLDSMLREIMSAPGLSRVQLLGMD